MGPDRAQEKVTVVDSGDDARTLVRDILAADMFSVMNGYALAQAIFAFSVSPLLEDWRKSGKVAVKESLALHSQLHPRHVVGLMRYLATQGLFREEGDEVFFATPKGQAALSRGCLGWLTMMRGGYGNLMERATDLMENKVTYGRDITRNGYYTAVGSCLTTGAILDPVPYQIAESRGWTCIGDLGCGAGQFLIEFALRNPSHGGVGIDLDADAIAEANTKAKKLGVADRVAFFVGDAFDLSKVAKECADVEVFYSFGFEHELFRDGEEAVLAHIDGIGTTFPGTRYLLGEPMVSRTATDGQFYWAHILSHQGMPRNIAGWRQVLARLQKGVLNEVFVPDHGMIGAFFDIEFRRG